MKRREANIVHRILRTMEELSSEFQKRGVSKTTADRQALMAALKLEGWPVEELETFSKTLPRIP